MSINFLSYSLPYIIDVSDRPPFTKYYTFCLRDLYDIKREHDNTRVLRTLVVFAVTFVCAEKSERCQAFCIHSNTHLGCSLAGQYPKVQGIPDSLVIDYLSCKTNNFQDFETLRQEYLYSALLK